MKRISKKIVAIMLTTAMVVQVVAGIAPAAKKVEAGANTDWDYSFNLTKSTSYGTDLDEAFQIYNYTDKETTAAASNGEPSDSTMATMTSWGTRNHGYLKLKKAQNGSWVSTMTYNREVTNFKAEVTYYSYMAQRAGIMFGGEAGTFPITFDSDNTNDKGVMIFLEDSSMGRVLNIGGAIVPETTNYLGGTTDGDDFGIGGQSSFNGTANVRGYKAFTDKTFVNETNISDSNPGITLVITVNNGLLSVYEKESPDKVVTVQLADSYEGGTVSMYTEHYNSSFKAFAIKKLADPIVYDYSFNLTNSTSYGTDLDEAFQIYNYTDKETTAAASNGEPSDSTMATMTSWGTRNHGYLKLKKAQNGSWVSTMTYNREVTNFKAEVTYYSYMAQRAGIMFGGEAGTFPITFDSDNTNDKGVMIFLEDSSMGRVLNIGGAIVPETTNYLGGTTDGDDFGIGGQSSFNGTANVRGYKAFTDKTFVNETNISDSNPGITLVITVNNGLLSVYEKESPDKVVTVQLADSYEGGTVSMYTEHYNSSFKAFSIEKYADPEIDPNLIKFDNLDLSTLEGWTSRIYDKTTGDTTSTEDITEQWFTGTSYEENLNGDWNPGFDKYNNAGLKPKLFLDENTPYILTSADDYENFESYFTYYQHSGRYSMIIGGQGEYPTAISDSAVHVYIHGTQTSSGDSKYELRVQGAVDLDSAVVTGVEDGKILRLEDTARLDITGYGYEQAAASATETTTVHVKVENGVLTASVDDMDAAIQVNLASTYVHGKISLSAVCSTYGGFKYLRVSELEPTPAPEQGTVNYNMTSKNEYAVVTVGTELAYSSLNAELKFDDAKYEFVRAIAASDNYRMLNDGVTAEGDTVTINAYTNQSEKYVDLYFKTLDDTRAKDFSQFAVTNKEMKVVGGKTVASIDVTVALSHDYSDDKTLDVADLVSTDNADNRAALREVLVGKNTSPLINKSALFLGDSIMNAACDHSGWYGRLTATYGMDCDEVAQDEWALTSDAGRSRIITQFQYADENKEYDFVMLEGGVNDILIKGDDAVWGEDQIDADATSYDTTTIAGAMQELIKKTQEIYGNAKIVYIINSEFGSSLENRQKFAALVKDVCEEHGIDYVDLSDTTTYPELEVINDENHADFRDYMVDDIHPNAKSYDLTAPIVAAKMEEVLLNNK